MYPHVQSDSSYLLKYETRYRVGGYFFLGNKPLSRINKNEPYSLPDNGALHVLSSIIKYLISSATESKLGAVIFNSKDAKSLLIMIKEMVYPQGVTPFQTDNKYASIIVNNTAKQIN